MTLKKFPVEQLIIGAVLFTLPISLRLNSLAIIITFAYFMYTSIKLKTYKNIKFYGISFAFFIAQLVSFFLSDNTNKATSELTLYLSFIIFPIAFSSLQNKPFFMKQDKLFEGLLYGVLLILLYGLIRFLYDILFLEARYDYGRGVALFLKYVPHHVYLSMFILISIYGVIDKVIVSKNRFIYIFIISLFYVALILLSSRMAIIISILILPIMIYYRIKNRINPKRSKQIILGLFFILILIGFSNNFSRDKILYTYYELANIATKEKPFMGISFRQDIWMSAFHLIKESPWIGYGIGDVQQILDNYYTNNGFDKLLRLNTHNQYLQLILQYGILITSLLFVFLIKVLRNLYVKRLYFLLFCWFVLASFSLTESILYRQWGVVLFAFIVNYSIYTIQYTDTKTII